MKKELLSINVKKLPGDSTLTFSFSDGWQSFSFQNYSSYGSVINGLRRLADNIEKASKKRGLLHLDSITK